MSIFARDTAVEQVSEDLWRAQIVEGWRIGAVPNGGYVLAIAGRVLAEALPQPDPFTVHIIYTAPFEIGALECEVVPLKLGGSTVAATLTMRQQGEVKAHISATYTDLGRLKGESALLDERPEITAWDSMEPLREHGIELRRNVDQRYFRGEEVFKRGEPDGSGVFEGWLALADGSATDCLSLLLFADSMAPPVFTLYGPLQWVPTVELSVTLRARPAPGPVQVRFRSRYMTSGVVEEDGELWDSDGQLVALSRQTSKVRVIPHEPKD